MSLPDPTVEAFFEAADYARATLNMSAVGAQWTCESALPRMTVGAVAGHLFLALRRVDKHLDEPKPKTAAARGIEVFEWLRVARDEDLDRDDHRTVRDDGFHVARWGWEAVQQAFADRVRKLENRLSHESPLTVEMRNGSLDFRTYLGTRVIELLVHADDLAVSVGVESIDPPPAATELAIGLLVTAARSIHGDLDVMRSLTRSARAQPGTPSVF
jgi:hypothetical protein